jgi:hypothetical protein
MKPMTMMRTAAMTCALAGVFACGNQNRTANRVPNDTGAARTDQTASKSSAEETPVTLTGCLQRGDGSNDFILTRVNEPSQSVGTTGQAAGTVEREQRRAASNAYSLNPKNDVKLDELVGKQVRVTGTMARRADLPSANGNAPNEGSRAVGTSQPGNDRSTGERPNIKEGDLAKVDVTSATATADVCSGGGPSSKTSDRGQSR